MLPFYYSLTLSACGSLAFDAVDKKLIWLAAVDTVAANSNVSLDAPHDRQQSDSCKQCRGHALVCENISIL